MTLTANLLDDVQRTLSNVNGLSLNEIHGQLKKYSKPDIQEALTYLMTGDSLGRVSMSNGYYRLAKVSEIWKTEGGRT
jgi:hypothetical protein